MIVRRRASAWNPPASMTVRNCSSAAIALNGGYCAICANSTARSSRRVAARRARTLSRRVHRESGETKREIRTDRVGETRALSELCGRRVRALPRHTRTPGIPSSSYASDGRAADSSSRIASFRRPNATNVTPSWKCAWVCPGSISSARRNSAIARSYASRRAMGDCLQLSTH